MNPTIKYISENKRIARLRRLKSVTKPSENNTIKLVKKFIPNKILYLTKLCKSLFEYIIIDIFLSNGELLTLLRKKNKKVKKNALVIGNGPSQGYLTLDMLQKFKESGGETFVVNFWNLNALLSDFIPNYLVISDPATLDMSNENVLVINKNIALLDYLKKNKSICIFCPINRCVELKKLIGHNRVIGFVDRELRGLLTNIKPIFPRGYVSMTLYKALSLAIWYGYKNIYLIGMDNTYPRNIYSDKYNSILNLEIHSGQEDFVVDNTENYGTISNYLKILADLFHDAHLFNLAGNVKNLDEYSLTDAFQKISLEDIF